MHDAPTCLKDDGIVPLTIRVAVTHRYAILAAALLLSVVLPSARASEKAAALALIDQPANSARVDPDVSKRQAEAALDLLRRDPNPDLEIRARLLLCDYYSERDRAAAEQQIAAATALLPQATPQGVRAGGR